MKSKDCISSLDTINALLSDKTINNSAAENDLSK